MRMSTVAPITALWQSLRSHPTSAARAWTVDGLFHLCLDPRAAALRLQRMNVAALVGLLG